MKTIKFNIKLLSPIIIKDDNNSDMNVINTLNYIPGGSLLGALAQAYIKSPDFNDTNFYDFFLSGNLSFSNAYPLVQNKLTFPVPFNFQINKRGDDTKLFNIFKKIPPDSKLKPVANNFIFITNDTFIMANVKTEYNLHHSRENRLLGHSTDGSIFNYESIKEFQLFSGFITGNDIGKFMDFANKISNLRIGLSKHSQYGHINISFDEKNILNELPLNSTQNNEIGIFLLSDVILKNENGFFISSIKNLENHLKSILNDNNLVIKNSLIRYDYRKLHKKIYNLKEPSFQYIKKGSSFILSLSKPLPDNYKELFVQGIGLKTTEGYGKIGLFDTEKEMLKKLQLDSNLDIQNHSQSKMASLIINNVYKQEAERLVVRSAINFAEETHIKITANLLSRLLLMIANLKSIDQFMSNFAHLSSHKHQKNQLENSYVEHKTLLEFIENFDIKNILNKFSNADILNNNFETFLYKKFFTTYFRILSKKIKEAKNVK